MDNERIRVGLLIEADELPNWAFQMVGKIKNSSYAEVVLLIKKTEKGTPQKLSTKLWLKRKYLLYNLYRKLDRKIFNLRPNAFERKNIQEIFNGPIVNVRVKETKYCDWIFDDDLKKIKEYKPDVLVRLGFRILKGDIFNIPKYGIWSLHHGDNAVNRGGPPGFWEVMNSTPETGVVLQILGNKLDGGSILYKSFSLTDKISVHRNTNKLYWKALSFIPRKLKELYYSGPTNFFRNVEAQNSSIEFYNNILYKPPTNLRMVSLLLNWFYRTILQRLKNLWYFDQWILQFKFDSQEEVSTVLYQFKKIIPPKDRIWADPQVLIKDGSYFIFIEEMLRADRKGWISMFELKQNGTYTTPIKVLEEDTHLSYPYIFQIQDEVFMIPENKKGGEVNLYRSKKSLSEWEFLRTLIKDIQAVDPTIIFHDEKYWLFINVIANEGASAHDELYLFYCDNILEDEFQPHPQNPVVSDVKKARPAGKPFLYKGALYRPSQNCSHHYGYGLQFNRIDKLSVQDYEEKTVSSIDPDWDSEIIGVHTFNTMGKLTITDALLRRRKFF